jgi:WD40 repeat protein
MPTINPFDLAWTRDGGQIWYRSLAMAVNLKDGATLPLLASLIGPDDIHYSALYPKILPPQQSGAEAVDTYLISPDGHWMTYNPSWAASGAITRINLRVAQSYNNDEIWWGHLQHEVYSLAWSKDSQNLFTGGQETQPGPISRFNALTGENQQLVDDVYWIGVGSDLQERSLALAPEATGSIASTDLNADWFCTQISSMACIGLPYGWLAGFLPWVTSSVGQSLYLTNLDVYSPLGWTTQVPGTIRFEIYDESGPESGSIEEWFIEQYPPDQQGVTWEPVTVDGVSGVHVLTPVYPDATMVLLPTQNGYLDINVVADVPGGFENPVVQRILQSIRFR